jgi:trimeric autotransporter adhesin
MNPVIQLKTTPPLLMTLMLLCSALSPIARALAPPPDGGYPGFNTAEGQNALFSLTTGVANTAVGWLSLQSDTDGSFNTAIGVGTLLFNIGNQSTGDGTQNTAVGAAALLLNTTGARNTAVGVVALLNNDGDGNTAVGFHALVNNATADANTATGAFALENNTTGASNTAIGFGALLFNTEGNDNTAIGDNALVFNATGGSNTAAGSFALHNNTSGNNNAAFGFNSLFHNTDGSNNTAIGDDALFNSTSGGQNTALGRNAGSGVTTANNVICIGANVAGANVDNSCFIGNIRGAVVAPDAVSVMIDSFGKLGTTTGSSRRFKKDIRQMDNASETILALKPVTFHYNSDKTETPQFGLIAEEVEKVNRDLVARDDQGIVYAVRYDAVNAMLLNEFLKEHRHVQEQDAVIARLQAQIQALTAGLRKVSAQIELSKSAPQTVLNNR